MLADCSAGCETSKGQDWPSHEEGSRTLMMAGHPALMAPRRGPRRRTETRDIRG